MSRPRHPKRDEAAKLWLVSKKKRALDDIALEIGVSPSLIRKWKCIDKWEELKLLNKSGEYIVCATKKSGGQIGNKNAVGAGAPCNNKNAVVTGEYESIFFDSMDKTELQLIKHVTLDKKDLLKKEIQLLTVRERRMLKRIEKFNGKETLINEMTRTIEHPLYDVKIKTVSSFDVVQALEDALTRIQAQKRQNIELLDKIERGEMECW